MVGRAGELEEAPAASLLLLLLLPSTTCVSRMRREMSLPLRKQVVVGTREQSGGV